MKTMKHATELFNEMMNNILQLVEKPKIKILLSCSGGLTTSYFASKLNEAAQLLDYHYAVSYTHLPIVGSACLGEQALLFCLASSLSVLSSFLAVFFYH